MKRKLKRAVAGLLSVFRCLAQLEFALDEFLTAETAAAAGIGLILVIVAVLKTCHRGAQRRRTMRTERAALAAGRGPRTWLISVTALDHLRHPRFSRIYCPLCKSYLSSRDAREWASEPIWKYPITLATERWSVSCMVSCSDTPLRPASVAKPDRRL